MPGSADIAARPLPKTLHSGARWLIAGIYLCVLGAQAAAVPLRLDEILQIAGSASHTWSGLMDWVARTPAAAPLHYIVQWPFVALGHTPLNARAVSLLAAAGSLLVFWRIAERMRIRNGWLVAAVFATAPVPVALAVLGRPGALALFLLLTATLLFLQIVETPSVWRTCLYSAVLVATIYTVPLAYAPAVGYLLFFFRFVALPQQRRTIWLLLPATFVPLLAYLPFYAWATPQASERWLYASAVSRDPLVQLWRAIETAGTGAAVQIAIVTLGSLAGLWASFLPRFSVRWSDTLRRKNMGIFCLFGGAAASIAAAFASSLANISNIELSSVAPAMTLLILVCASGVEYHRFGARNRTLMPVLAMLLIVIGVGQDVLLTRTRIPNVAAVADAAVPEIKGEACVVFVSENLSKPLFATFRPELASSECSQFFHHRIVLAVHHWVRPDQLHDAETYFRGLDFVEVKRITLDGGEVIVLEQGASRTTPS